MKKPKKIHVVGGSGFIGTSLVRLLLSQNIDVEIFDKNLSADFPKLTSIGDVRNLDDLRNSITENSVIINLAAEHKDNVVPASLYYDVNLGGAENIIKVAEEKNVETIVFTSTVAVYGFAEIGADEHSNIQPFNEYGKSKFEAEKVFENWQSKSTEKRTLVILRPTVVFGERNRGNVYNLLNQIRSKKFVMIGNGKNTKSMAYIENIVAFMNFCLKIDKGKHIFNYSDSPDFTMNELVHLTYSYLGFNSSRITRIPFFIGLAIGKVFDLVSFLFGKKFIISSIRVKKFCANSSYSNSIETTGFIRPYSLKRALKKTINYEFIEKKPNSRVFFTE